MPPITDPETTVQDPDVRSFTPSSRKFMWVEVPGSHVNNLFEVEFEDRLWAFVQKHQCSNEDCTNDFYSWMVFDTWADPDESYDEETGADPLHSREGISPTLAAAKSATLESCAAYLTLLELEDPDLAMANAAMEDLEFPPPFAENEAN